MSFANHVSIFALGALSLSLVACSQPGSILIPAALYGGTPVLSQKLTDRAKMFVTVVDRRDGAARSAQAIGGLTYDAIGLTLSNSVGLMSRDATTSVAAGSATASGSASISTRVFSNLRPGNGYAMAVSLTNADAQVGHGRANGISLPPSVTTVVTIVIGQDGNIEIVSGSSTTGNSTADSSLPAGSILLTKGDTLSFKTGFAGSEAGVASYSVIASGSLFSDSQDAVLANFSASTGFDTFVWNTGASNALLGATFDTDKLTTSSDQNGSLTFRLFDANSHVIGETSLDHVYVGAAAAIDLMLE